MLTRRGERAYCYRYDRVGGRVRRVYVACGEAALEAQARLDEERRRRQDRCEQAQAEALRHAEALSSLEGLSRLLDLLVKASLTRLGYRRHARGEWRLTRR